MQICNYGGNILLVYLPVCSATVYFFFRSNLNWRMYFLLAVPVHRVTVASFPRWELLCLLYFTPLYIISNVNIRFSNIWTWFKSYFHKRMRISLYCVRTGIILEAAASKHNLRMNAHRKVIFDFLLGMCMDTPVRVWEWTDMDTQYIRWTWTDTEIGHSFIY